MAPHTRRRVAAAPASAAAAATLLLLLAASPLAAAQQQTGAAAPKPAVPKPVPTAAPKPAAAAPAAASGAPKPTAPAAAPKLSPGAVQPGPDKILRIGVVVPLTGNKADQGRAIKAAVEMAVRDEAPKRLPGVAVEVVSADSLCGDVPSLRGSADLARVQGVDVLVGDVCSAASLASTSVANKFQIPMVSPSSTATSLSTAGDYFFRTVPSDRYQGQYASAKLTELGARTAAVVYSESSYGQSLSFSFIAAFTRDGGRAFPIAVPSGAGKNLTAVVDELRRVKPDAVYIASNDVQWMGALIKGIKEAKLPVRIFGSDATMDVGVAKVAGFENAVGVRGSDVSFGSPDFVSAFQEYTKGKGIGYSSKAAHAYDAATALIEAYRRAKDPKTGPQIKAELSGVKLDGKSGPVAFDEFGDLAFNPGTSYDVTEFDRNGQVRVLESRRR